MARPSRRTLIPIAYSDLNLWPTLDTSGWHEIEQEQFRLRVDAVKRYHLGESFEQIRVATTKSEGEVRRLVKRCLELFDDGKIAGFRSLHGSEALNGYSRKSKIVYEKGSGPGGCSGAMTELFKTFPELQELVEDLYLGRPTTVSLGDTRKGLIDIHKVFEKWLRDAGLTDEDWPFCTKNRGYQSLWRHLQNFHLENVQRAASSRFGKDTARKNSLGNGTQRLIPCLRPFSSTQLDFHKVDAASIITITNQYGKEFDVPVSRWHIGFLVEETYFLILGSYVCLVLNPSGDDVLEVIESALEPEVIKASDPRCNYVEDGKSLLIQLMPELKYQCFSMLKVDNAWSNAAHEVVSNIMDTVGCAVNFGPSRNWWRRAVIENLNGALTRAGLQKLPSTYGSGISDTRAGDPVGAALKYRIHVSELVSVLHAAVHEHNTKCHSALGWSSPIECMRNALCNPSTGFIYQPVPAINQKNLLLLWHREEVVVAGDLEKNVRPHFRTLRWIFNNPLLANSFDLIGKTITIYINRRKCRIIHAYETETGRYLGLMMPNVQKTAADESLRDRRYLIRANMGGPNHGSDYMSRWEQDKKEELISRGKSKAKKNSKDALALAKLALAKERDIPFQTAKLEKTAETPLSMKDAEKPKPIDHANDIFGLRDVPKIQVIVRRLK